MTSVSWELNAVRYAESTLPESDVIVGGNRDVRCPITFLIYCIRTGDRCIVVDPGCDDLPGFILTDYVHPVEALKEIGVYPEMVTDVVITHAHHDHIDAVRYFPGSTVHIQEAEYQGGKHYIPASCAVNCFEEEAEIALGIRVLRTGGHSEGASVVILEGKEKPWVLCGDECYLRICLEKKIPTGVSCCPEKSRAFVEKYSSPEYRTFLTHDPGMKIDNID